MENIKVNNEEIIKIFIPLKIKRRGGTAVVIMPRNINPEDQKKSFNDNMIQSFAKAHKWKRMLDEDKIGSLADISRKEGVGTSYVSKVFNLNFIAPEIIKRILDGTQPRDLKLIDMTQRDIPMLWNEQKELWGF
jgi:hypothetical protein